MLDGDEDVVMDARDDAINCPASEGLEEEDTITLEQEVHVEEDEFVHDGSRGMRMKVSGSFTILASANMWSRLQDGIPIPSPCLWLLEDDWWDPPWQTGQV